MTRFSLLLLFFHYLCEGYREELIAPELKGLQRAQALPTGAAVPGDTNSNVPPRQTQETRGRCSVWERCRGP